jgi:ketosteroid isomerase-like protein
MKNLLAVLLLFAIGPLHAAEDPAHEELRTLRKEIITAITKGDIDTVLSHVHPDVVVTWQNSEVCRGRQGLKEFFNRMGKKSFKGYKVPPTPDDLTLLHGGDTGVSFGKTVAEYDLLGSHYQIESRWTATLVKENGKWLLGAYHISMNTLDNPLLTAAKNALYIAGAAGLVIGILIGRILGRRGRV